MSSNDEEDTSVDKTKSNKNISSCCCGCAEQFVKLINLCISTAYSNRFLQEITGKDKSMQHVSDLLGSISVALHFLAAELSAHILNVEPHLNHFKIFDPKYPSWKGDPTKFVLEGNKVVVVAIEVVVACVVVVVVGAADVVVLFASSFAFTACIIANKLLKSGFSVVVVAGF